MPKPNFDFDKVAREFPSEIKVPLDGGAWLRACGGRFGLGEWLDSRELTKEQANLNDKLLTQDLAGNPAQLEDEQVELDLRSPEQQEADNFVAGALESGDWEEVDEAEHPFPSE